MGNIPDELTMSVITITNKFLGFNSVSPSSTGAAGATTFARPPTAYISQPEFVADAPSELLGDVLWLQNKN